MENSSLNQAHQDQKLQQGNIIPPFPNSTRKIALAFFILIILIVISIILLIRIKNSTQYIAYKPTTKQDENQSIDFSNNPYLHIKTEEIKNALITYVPNYENLKLEDLPNIYDVRAIYPYNNHLILVGSPNILEVDVENNRIIRAANRKVSDCFYYSIKIGNDLYLACNRSDQLNLRGIYKLNLKNGTVVKSYTPKGMVDFTNLNIALNKTTIWGGVQNGVIKIDTLTDEVKFYPASTFPYQGHCPWYNIGANDKFVWVTPQASNCKGVSVYNEASNTWDTYLDTIFKNLSPNYMVDNFFTFAYSADDKFYIAVNGGIGYPGDYVVTFDDVSGKWVKVVDGSIVKLETPQQYRDKYFPDALLAYNGGSHARGFNYYDYKRGRVMDYSWDTNFISIAGKRGEKYYIVANNGIYTLSKNSFPKLLISAKIHGGIPELSKSYVDKDERYAFIIGPIGGYYGNLNPTVSSELSAELVDLKTGDAYDLIETNGYSNAKITDEISEIINKISESTIEEIENGILLIDAEAKKELIMVDFLTKKLVFR